MKTNALIRQKIWSRLAAVALPDSRFHLNFAEVIPDFQGSRDATDRICSLPFFEAAQYLFITPDNCLAELRRRLIAARRTIVVSTYGIYRGFFVIEAGSVPPGQELFASWLDGLEHFGRPIGLAEIAAKGRFDAMVTGASAVSLDGVRFGKGHGFFDLEWGMFTDLGIADETTPVLAAVHDVQVVEDKLVPSPTDIIVDWIATPTRLHRVARSHKRPRGIRWELLSPETIAATPPLVELQRLRGVLPP
jgi:5-formyltetrahydrofolate cyclo-ligase